MDDCSIGDQIHGDTAFVRYQGKLWGIWDTAIHCSLLGVFLYCPLNINFQAPSESDELTLVDVKSPTGIVYAWLGQIVTFFAYSLPSM
eukprot:scaffold30029_cov34-Phaeocystis_antarctica.AAC.1